MNSWLGSVTKVCMKREVLSLLLVEQAALMVLKLTLVFTPICWCTVELLTRCYQTWTPNRSTLDHRPSEMCTKLT